MVYVLLSIREQQRPQDGPPVISRTRASDSGGETRRTPPSNADDAASPPSSKPGWAEEGGGGWGGQGAPSNYQVKADRLAGSATSGSKRLCNVRAMKEVSPECCI